MNLLKKRLNSFRPKFLLSLEPIISRYAQYGGGSKDEKYDKGKAFSNVYEFYIYAFFIGLAKNKTLDITPDDETKDFWEIENWKPAELAEQLIICAIAESDFDMNAVEKMHKDELYSESTKVLSTIERYANGGLLYIKQEIENNQELAEDEMLFVNFLEDN
jgi:hypothetical protein|tara:strand:- start:1562 stop:2044 length:483 start_codon:yes stop_codon:yes gene_type:complete